MRWKLNPLLGAVALMCASPCNAQPDPNIQAEPDPLAGFYSNTLRIEVQDYRALRFFEPDHTYHDLVRGKVVKGSWTVEGDHICTQQPGTARFCNLGLGKTAGEMWLDKDPYTGNEVRFALEAGRKADR
jgi:hypothetical protein